MRLKCKTTIHVIQKWVGEKISHAFGQEQQTNHPYYKMDGEKW